MELSLRDLRTIASALFLSVLEASAEPGTEELLERVRAAIARREAEIEAAR